MKIETMFEGQVVLIIEEDANQRDKARSFLLVRKAKKILDTADFIQAYNLIQKQKVDYYICDYRLFNTHAQSFIKKLRKEKKLSNDNQLIMSADFYEAVEKLKNKTVEPENRAKKKTTEQVLDEDIKNTVAEIYKPFCEIKAYMLIKSSNEAVEATILNIDLEELLVTISTNSLEKQENYARQIKFESNIEGITKNYTIIGDMKLIDDSDQFYREFELAVPEQYKEILMEIENDLFGAQRKTLGMLHVMKGD